MNEESGSEVGNLLESGTSDEEKHGSRNCEVSDMEEDVGERSEESNKQDMRKMDKLETDEFNIQKREISNDLSETIDGNKDGNLQQDSPEEKRNPESQNTRENELPLKLCVKMSSRTPTRGIKRSHGKPNLISCKRKKLAPSKKLFQKDASVPRATEEEVLADNECSDDSDSDGWQILEEKSDTELDKALEKNASKNKLTAFNVKTILHQVITNEHVVAMVKNTILNELASKEELKAATYEPKMTRAKVKKVIEETGDVMHPWPLTPLKKKKEHVKTILDIELSEEEEDDDYNPDKEKEESFSDEDGESVTSSQMSDFGSPCPPTPVTPSTPTAVESTSDLRNTPSSETEYKGPFLSPMGPPVRLPLYRQSLSKKFQDVEELTDKTREDQTIAARTRSKLSLEDTSITDLESTFVPPDFTPDMYDNQCDDKDWQGFLQSLYKPPESENTNDGVDDEEKDPEYNYLEEIDEMIDSDEELRDDRAVKISKKEMNELMDELFEYYQEIQPMEEDEKKAMKIKAKTHFKRQVIETECQKQGMENQNYVISDNEREQIADQMRKHVQLLTQMYVSAMGNQAEYKEVAIYSKNLLMEINQFSVTNTQFMTPNSLYNAANLREAVNLVNKTEEWEQIERIKPSKKGMQYVSSEKSIASMLVKNYHTLSKKKKDFILNIVGDAHSKSVIERLQSNRLGIPHFTNQQKQLIWTSPVFMYPELVPGGGFMFREDLQGMHRRVAFTVSEDKLMALGLDQFKHLPYSHELIRKFLLPCKTEENIRIRIKNLTSSKASPNIIKNYKLTKKLPDFPHFTGVFSLPDMKSPKNQDTERLPTWCKEFKIREIMASTDEDLEKNGMMQRSSSVNIPLVSVSKEMVEDDKSNSAPVTPMTKSQDQVHTVIIVPNLTPEKSEVASVSPSMESPAFETSATQSTLPVSAILLTNVSLSSGTKTLGLPLSNSPVISLPMVAEQTTIPCPVITNQISSTDSPISPLLSSSFPAVSNQNILPLNTIPSAINPFTCTLVNSFSRQMISVPTLSSHVVSVPSLPIQTLPSPTMTELIRTSQTMTEPILASQTITEPILASQTMTQPILTSHAMTQPILTSQTMTQPILASQTMTQPILASQAMTEPILASHTIAQPILTSQTITQPILASQAMTQPILTSQTMTQPILASQTMTKPILASQTVTTPSCQSMPILSEKFHSSESVIRDSCLPQNNPLSSNLPIHSGVSSTELYNMGLSDVGSDGDMGMAHSPIEDLTTGMQSCGEMTVSVQTERCISPDKIEPTVKMKKTDSVHPEMMKEVLKMRVNMKDSDAVSESPSRIKKKPFSPGFIPLHQESVQTELCGNPGSPLLIRVVDNVPSPVDQSKEKNDVSVTEVNKSENVNPCESNLSAEKMEKKEKDTLSQSEIENVFLSDSMIPGFSPVSNQSGISNTSVNATLVAADNSGRESTSSIKRSPEPDSAASLSLLEVNQSRNVHTDVSQVYGTTETISSAQQFPEYSRSRKLLGIPIENKMKVNQLPSTSRSGEQEADGIKSSCKAHLIGSMNSLSFTQSKPLVSASPMKSALEIVATYSSLMLSPKKCAESFVQKAQETTPVKSRYRPLAPKPYTPTDKTVSPFLGPHKSPRKSPRRQQLQRKARAICPKGLVVKTVISPSKKAASQIMNRVLGKAHCKILPCPPGLPRKDLQIRTRGSEATQVPHSVEPLRDEAETEVEGVETASECDTAESEYLSDEVMEDTAEEKKRSARKNLQSKFHKKREVRNSVESDDTEAEDPNLDDSQDDDDSEHIADLMAASTTIKFNPKSTLSKESKDLSSKTKRRKDAALAMLVPDIVDTDPQKDDRDTAFAKAYLTKVAETLKDDFTTYKQFLKILYEFGKSEQSPVKLYRDMTELLKNFPDLVEDFSVFLSPSQAVECGCFMENLRFRRARVFLRKLEVYAERHPSHYQKIMKILTKWSPGSKEEDKAVKELLEPVLKSQPHLLDELSCFFEDERPPDSYMTEFEEITLGDSDEEEGFKFDEFEEVVVPEDENPDGTKKCTCTCHQNPKAKNFHMRNIHCTNCCLKVIDGELYYRINKQVLKKVRVKYHPEINPNCNPLEKEMVAEPTSAAHWEEDEEAAEKENVQIMQPKHIGIKLKISSRKKGKQGRFFSINEMADSPVKKSASTSTAASDDQASKIVSLPSTSEPPSEMADDGVQNSEEGIEKESASESRTDEQGGSGRHSEESQLSSELPDLIPSQDQKRQEEMNSGGALLKIEESSQLSRVSRTVQVTVTADCNEDFTGAIISIPNNDTTPPKKSDRELTISSWIESANLSPQKTSPSVVDEVAMSGYIPQSKDSSSSDLLAKALHEAMISQSDVSMSVDSSQQGRNTHETCPSEVPGSATDQGLGFSMLSEMTSVKNDQTVDELNSDKKFLPCAKERKQMAATSSTERQRRKVSEKRRIVPTPVTEDASCPSPAFSLSSIDNVGFLKSPTDSSQIIAYTNSPVFGSENSNPSLAPYNQNISPNPKMHTAEESLPSCFTAEQELRLIPNRIQQSPMSASSPSGTIISSVVGFGQEESNTCGSIGQRPGRSSNERETNPAAPQIAWTRDMDKMILETVKLHGPGSKTFDDITKQIPGSTPASVIDRFHILLEMLADDTPSEDDTTEEGMEPSS